MQDAQGKQTNDHHNGEVAGKHPVRQLRPEINITGKRLEKVAGVSRVIFKETRGQRSMFEVEGLKDRSIRGDLARAVVESGWNLNELRSGALTLEEVFLELTGAQKTAVAEPEPAVQGVENQ